MAATIYERETCPPLSFDTLQIEEAGLKWKTVGKFCFLSHQAQVIP